MLWLLSLPFALWTIMGTSMVPACLVISYVSALHYALQSWAWRHAQLYVSLKTLRGLSLRCVVS